MGEVESLSNSRQLLTAMGEVLFGFALFAAIVWVARRGKRWLLARTTQVVAEKAEKISSKELRTAGLRSFVTVVRSALNFLLFLFVSFWLYALLWYQLQRFPYTRPWGDYLRSQCLSALASLGRSALAAVPGLIAVAFIVLTARMLAQVLGRLFTAAERGQIQTRMLEPVTAATTRRLVTLLVWVIAVIVAYPYIPGSETPAFKGVTVFAGLMLSLGSTNLVSQWVSGLLLIYSHAFRAGDYVRVGDTEGTVLGVGMSATRIRTIKNEEVYIANSVLLGTATKNYSQFSASHGVFVPVKVTIGYSTPWRQVHALLLEAARRTAGLAPEPAPFVLQTQLSDFYVEYELNARLAVPNQRAWVLSALHAHVQDVFNEYGVQIMSPHYLQDPAKPQVVPKGEWFSPPAKADGERDVKALKR